MVFHNLLSVFTFCGISVVCSAKQSEVINAVISPTAVGLTVIELEFNWVEDLKRRVPTN